MARRIRTLPALPLVLALLLVLPAQGAPAADDTSTAPVDVRLSGPPPFGLLIGDLVTHRVAITADPGLRLQDASLPRPGALTYWLTLRDITVEDQGVEEGRRRFHLALTYQTFYAPLQPHTLTIPAFTLRFVDEEVPDSPAVTAGVPAWRFLTSPLREIVPQAGTGGPLLRPDHRPPLAGDPLTRPLAIAALAGAVIFLGLLAWHRGWGPFRLRPNRPFRRALRDARTALGRAGSRQSGDGLGATDAAAYEQAMRAFHRAFDMTAGHRLLADDLPGFLETAPAFRPEEAAIQRFFQASRQVFFRTDSAAAVSLMPAPALLDLGRRLCVAERARP